MNRNALNVPILAGLLLFAATSIVRYALDPPHALTLTLYLAALALEVWGVVQIGRARLGH